MTCYCAASWYKVKIVSEVYAIWTATTGSRKEAGEFIGTEEQATITNLIYLAPLSFLYQFEHRNLASLVVVPLSLLPPNNN